MTPKRRPCIKCGSEFIADVYVRKDGYIGWQSYCKPCRRQLDRERYQRRKLERWQKISTAAAD